MPLNGREAAPMRLLRQPMAGLAAAPTLPFPACGGGSGRGCRRWIDRLRRRFVSIAALLLVVVALMPGNARAQDRDTALAALASGNLERIRQGVEQLAASGDPRAADILGALQAGRLLVGPGQALFIRTENSVVIAESGEPAPDSPTSALKPVRINNPVRNAVAAALGGLRLFSPDPGLRLEAAEAVFQSRDPETLPAIARALAKETDPAITRRLQQARAASLLSAPDASGEDRIAAIAVLRERGDLAARGLLAGVAAGSQPEAVAIAAREAVAAIDRRLQMWSIVQNLYFGLSLGSVLLLAAAGLAITFGVMGVINMAHGEMVMIGAYTTFVVQQAMRTHLPEFYAVNLLVAVPAAFLVAGLIGIAIERGLIRWLYGRPLETLLATWGLSLLLQQAVRSIFGANNREVDAPSWMTGVTQLGGLTLTWNRLYIILFAILVLAAMAALLRFTSFGLRMRAVTQNRRMAAAMGIRTPWVDALTFGLGSGVAGMAGVALSQIDNVSPNLGQSYIIDSFMVVVFGGVGNLWGAALGALSLGVLNKFLEPYAGAVLGKIFVLILLILFIQGRPRGLFPLKGRAAEA
jgi:urea transport system permease protein